MNDRRRTAIVLASIGGGTEVGRANSIDATDQREGISVLFMTAALLRVQSGAWNHEMAWRYVVAVLTGVVLVVAGLGGVPAAAAGSPELLYVASATDPVGIFDAGSSGAVLPNLSIPDPHLSGTFWDPWTVAVDGGSNAYLQSYLSSATTFVYPEGSSGPASRVFQVTGPDSEGIAVDAQGYEYVMGGQASPQITVAPPGAAGTPSPVRQFSTDQDGFNPWPSSIAVDGQGDLVVVVLKHTGNAIEIFQGGPNGSNTALRSVTGAHTGLGSCTDLSTCDHIAVTFSAATGEIYAAVSTTTGTHISVFAGSASGDTPPLQTIAGPSTGLAGTVITGVAVSQLTGDIYTMVKPSQFSGPAHVAVFHGTATGDTSPVRTFTDSNSGMQNAQGIALSVPSPPPALPEAGQTALLAIVASSLLAGTAIRHRRRARRDRAAVL